MAWKEVRFDLYCKTCVHKETDEEDPPCRYCLNDFKNWDTHKPTKYLKDEEATEE